MWQDDVVTLGPRERAVLEKVYEPAATLDLQAPGRVRLRLRYDYSAGRATKAPAAANVPKETGAMGTQEPFELVGTVDVTIERPIDVVIEAATTIRAGADTRLAEALRVRAVGKDGTARTLAASRWWVEIEFEDISERLVRPLARDVAVAAGATAAIPLDTSMTFSVESEGTFRVRAVLRALDPDGCGPRIVSAWTDLRVAK